jgi:hypothetical protein
MSLRRERAPFFTMPGDSLQLRSRRSATHRTTDGYTKFSSESELSSEIFA